MINTQKLFYWLYNHNLAWLWAFYFEEYKYDSGRQVIWVCRFGRLTWHIFIWDKQQYLDFYQRAAGRIASRGRLHEIIRCNAILVLSSKKYRDIQEYFS